MLNALKQETNYTLTENGAVTYASTGSACLDFFAAAGALRRAGDQEILDRFARAYAECPDDAMKLLFFTRDIRGGLGERRVFRVIMKHLADHEPASVRKNIPHIAAFGRFDDLLSLMDTACEPEMMAYLKACLAQDMDALREGGAVSLLGKWLPSVNASSGETVRHGKKIARALGMTEQAYRQTLTALRQAIRILENSLRLRDYTFDYARQPSRAMLKYRRAFLRNDGERYWAFLEDVAAGRAVLHAGGVSPYELVTPFLSRGICASDIRSVPSGEEQALNTTWASLPDFGGEEDALAVIDTSGSMYMDTHPMPAAVALSLGLYFAERNKGAFRNHFITFSRRPQLIEVKGETFADRLRYVSSFSEAANTNLAAVFNVILRAAVKHGVPQSELPSRLIIISDMEFDVCMEDASAVNFQRAKEKFAAAGYALPQVVFWNVASRNRHQPVTMNEQGVALVSGATPLLFSLVAGQGDLTPVRFMREVLDSERYAPIVA